MPVFSFKYRRVYVCFSLQLAAIPTGCNVNSGYLPQTMTVTTDEKAQAFEMVPSSLGPFCQVSPPETKAKPKYALSTLQF